MSVSPFVVFLAHVYNACLTLHEVSTLEHYCALFHGGRDPLAGTKYNVAAHAAANFISYYPTGSHA